MHSIQYSRCTVSTVLAVDPGITPMSSDFLYFTELVSHKYQVYRFAPTNIDYWQKVHSTCIPEISYSPPHRIARMSLKDDACTIPLQSTLFHLLSITHTMLRDLCQSKEDGTL
jgi:hypothetical protein